MPGIQIDFLQKDYDRIPGKKRTWLRDLVLRELDRLDGSEPVGLSPEQTFWFDVQGEKIRSSGVSPAAAARRLGLAGPLDWKTEAEATALGWADEPSPLDV